MFWILHYHLVISKKSRSQIYLFRLAQKWESLACDLKKAVDKMCNFNMDFNQIACWILRLRIYIVNWCGKNEFMFYFNIVLDDVTYIGIHMHIRLLIQYNSQSTIAPVSELAIEVRRQLLSMFIIIHLFDMRISTCV
mgnify:CR=1 FL=1